MIPAPPFQSAVPASAGASINPSANMGDDNAKSASVPEYLCDLIFRRRQALKGSGHQPVLNNNPHTAPVESAADEISTPNSQSVAHPPRRDGSQPGPIGASPADEAQAAPFHCVRVAQVEAGSHPSVPVSNPAPATSFPPRVSSSHSHARVTLAGKDTSLAGLPASFLSEDPCLSAQRAMGIC